LLRAANQDHEGSEDRQVVDQEVGTSGCAGCREDPRPLNEDLSEVVGISDIVPESLRMFQKLVHSGSRIFGGFATLRLGAAEDEVADGVHQTNGDQVVPGHSRSPVDEVLGDEGWQEGERVVGGDEGESVSGVHGVVREEVVLLEEHRVQSVDNLECSSKGHDRIDDTSVLGDRVENEEDVEDGQPHHREPERLQLQIGARKVGIELAAVEEVHDRVASVALRIDVRFLPAKKLGYNGGNGRQDEGHDERGDHDVEVLVGDEAHVNFSVDESRSDGQQGDEADEAVHADVVARGGLDGGADGQEGEETENESKSDDGRQRLRVPVGLDVASELAEGELRIAAVPILVGLLHETNSSARSHY
jgi:hypothetical protein